MKKNLLTLLMGACSLGLLGQTYTYHPFPQDSGFYKYSVHDDFWNLWGWTEEYVIQDTSSSGNIMWHSEGKYYEDNKRIYFKHSSDSIFRLAFDFNLTVGDTFMLPFPTPNDSFAIVYGEDSIDPYDYPGRRVLYLQSNTLFGQWVEGVGNVTSVGSVMHSLKILSVSGGSVFRCLESDGVSFPCPDAYSVSIQEHSQTVIKAYPNPTSDILNVELESGTTPSFFTVTSLLGQVVLEDSFTPKGIDLSRFPNGEYIVRLFDNSKQSLGYVKVLVKR
ncbi:MAG: hypothetical protein SchgKO_25630 [Schleiferiaceae bacterium]